MTPWLDDGDVRLFHGDALEVLRELPSGSVHMCATSPPFFGLRDYGTGEWEGGDEGCDHIIGTDRQDAGRTSETFNGGHATSERYAGRECPKCGARRTDQQIGLEETPDQWVARLVAVFREVRRVLRDDGTLWVEIGDSYSGGGSAGSEAAYDPKYKQSTNRGSADRVGKASVVPPGTKPKDLLGQPWLLARALQQPYYTGRIRDERDRVWLAAIIDGEGSIQIHKRKAGTSSYARFDKADGTTAEYLRTRDSYQPKLEITNTNVALLKRIIAITGEGNTNVKQAAGTHGRKQTIYRWCVTADKARDVLREVYPHLVAKQHEARLALGCSSSGDKAAAAHEALKQLHGGNPTGIDFPAPESMFEAGWFLRSEIIWARLHPNPMPESVTDRPTKSHSTVFLLSKRPRYYWDADAIREAYQARPQNRFTDAIDGGKTKDAISAGARRWNGLALGLPAPQAETLDGSTGESPRGPDGRRVTTVKGTDASEQHRDGERWPNPTGANARSVWTIPTEPTSFAHFATWPRKLVARMIQAGTSERGACPECGAPWVRETEATKYEPEVVEVGVRNVDASRGDKVRKLSGAEFNKQVRRTTLGWSPSCDCGGKRDDQSALGYSASQEAFIGAPITVEPLGAGHNSLARAPVPCVVLDPFAGSGTTCLVARHHGRHSVGIELNEQYLEIARTRLQQLSLLST